MTDAQHNVAAMVAENGQVVERYAYDPYGRAVVLNGENDPDGAREPTEADASCMLTVDEVARIIRTMVDPGTAFASGTIVDTMVLRRDMQEKIA